MSAGHALMLGMAGFAIFLDRCVGVARTPANLVVAGGMVVCAGLLVPESFGLLPKPWARATWVMVVAVFLSFVALNFF
jgi:hypothetical protein